jgi:hypothetical protein
MTLIEMRLRGVALRAQGHSAAPDRARLWIKRWGLEDEK